MLASFVLGIISLVIGFLSSFGMWLIEFYDLVPVVIALACGIVALVLGASQRNEKKGLLGFSFGIAGAGLAASALLSILALLIIGGV